MHVEVTKRRFTVDEYYQMAVAGILGAEERVELIDGEIIQMSPIGHRHAVCVTQANRLLVLGLKDRGIVSPQNPLHLNNYTELEPDIVVLKWRSDYYTGKKWLAEDALLVIEVSDTTFLYDRNTKLPRYAAAGVPEVWIENLTADELLVYRSPDGDQYTSSQVLYRRDSIALLAFPDVVFQVDELLGPNP